SKRHLVAGQSKSSNSSDSKLLAFSSIPPAAAALVDSPPSVEPELPQKLYNAELAAFATGSLSASDKATSAGSTLAPLYCTNCSEPEWSNSFCELRARQFP